MRRIVLARVVYKVERSITDASSSGNGEAAPLQVVAKEVPTPAPAASVSPEHTGAAVEPSAPSAAVDTPQPAQAGETCTAFITTPPPKELLRRSFLAPSMIAHILTSKYLLGVPFYRLEQQLELQGASLDRGTMCRYAEDTGATLGAIVEAARKEAFETAFCLSTDATGVSIQPGPIQERKDKKPGPCRKGHFFVVLADKDHVDPETYLADVIRVMSYWPRERYLELSPRYWARTRARLIADEIKLPLGPITVPPPLPAEEQRPTS